MHAVTFCKSPKLSLKCFCELCYSYITAGYFTPNVI